MTDIVSILRKDLAKLAGHKVHDFVCSLLGDHKCLGPDVVHIGMVCTMRHGAHFLAYRIVWLSPGKKHAVVMPLDMLHDGLDKGRYTQRFFGQPGTSIRLGKDHKWWQEGGQWANKSPVKMGVGTIDWSPEV